MSSGFLAMALSFLVVSFSGPAVIPLLRKLRFGQQVRDDGPKKHLEKMGTPTMGGVLIVGGIFISGFIIGPRDSFLITALLTMLFFGLIGFADDYIKVVLKRPLGLKARYKLTAQLIGAALLAYTVTGPLDLGTQLVVPFIYLEISLGWLYYPFVMALVIGTVNGVNLTDGLDGLAAGTMIFPMFVYGLFSFMAGGVEILVFSWATLGACAAFLVYNMYPAKIFMGDTGSFALGSSLAVVALLTKNELLLLVLGGVYVIETISVILQVLILRWTGKRIFKMAPLHHHYELSGLDETKVVRLFWSVSAVLAVIGYFGMNRGVW